MQRALHLRRRERRPAPDAHRQERRPHPLELLAVRRHLAGFTVKLLPELADEAAAKLKQGDAAFAKWVEKKYDESQGSCCCVVLTKFSELIPKRRFGLNIILG